MNKDNQTVISVKNVTKKYIKHVGGKTHEEKNGTCT